MLIEKNLRGLSSVSLSKAELCHRRAPSISFHFKHPLCLRSEGWKIQKVVRSESPGSSPLLPPQPGHHWAVTILGEEISFQKWNQYYIINVLCLHPPSLSWTVSRAGATVVPSSHTSLASTHSALAWLLHIPSPMSSLSGLNMTSDPTSLSICVIVRELYSGIEIFTYLSVKRKNFFLNVCFSPLGFA